MDYLQLIETMPPELYQRLVQAVERGKWPDGRVLSPEQRENALQAIIAWGERHLEETERVGFVPKKKSTQQQCDTDTVAPVRWKD
jgi:uncharacterized protein YeaC (DUF1315 family)